MFRYRTREEQRENNFGSQHFLMEVDGILHELRITENNSGGSLTILVGTVDGMIGALGMNSNSGQLLLMSDNIDEQIQTKVMSLLPRNATFQLPDLSSPLSIEELIDKFIQLEA